MLIEFGGAAGWVQQQSHCLRHFHPLQDYWSLTLNPTLESTFLLNLHPEGQAEADSGSWVPAHHMEDLD